MNKKPFKPEQIPSPIYGYHQDMRPKRTESKEESSSVQMKAAETARRVTLLSEEAERERNVRQQMNIPSIRKENRMEETVPAPAEERVDMQTDVTPLTLQEELTYHDHVQSTMERLNDEPFIQTEEKEPAFSEPQDHIEADLHHQQTEVYHEPPVESEPVQDVSSENEEIQDKPVEQFVDHTQEIEIEPLTFETDEDTHSAIEMEVDISAEEVEVLDVISAESDEDIEADSLEDHQEEVPAAH